MSLWDRILGSINKGEAPRSTNIDLTPIKRNANSYAFVDVEVGVKNHKIQDIGALRYDGATLHKNSKADLQAFLRHIDFCVATTLCITTQNICLAMSDSHGRLSTPYTCRHCCSPNGPTTDL